MSDTIKIDFVFVPPNAPFPEDWVARHPDYFVLPARFVGPPEMIARLLGKTSPKMDTAEAAPAAIKAGLDFGLAGVRRDTDQTVQIAAVGDLKCDGFFGGCGSGGSAGTTGMFLLSGRILCWNCAVKMAGASNETAAEKTRLLQPFVLKPR